MIVNQDGQPIMSPEKKKEETAAIPENIYKRACVQGFDPIFPLVRDKQHLRNYVNVRFQNFKKHDKKRLQNILGITNNFFALQMAIREDQIEKLIEENRELRKKNSIVGKIKSKFSKAEK